jgi:hypothetical protein
MANGSQRRLVGQVPRSPLPKMPGEAGRVSRISGVDRGRRAIPFKRYRSAIKRLRASR